MAEELKACPFCGGEAEIERVGTARMSTIYFCTECSCRLETGETFNHGELWNRRAQLSQGGEAVEVVAWRHWGDKTRLLCDLGKQRAIPGTIADEFTVPLMTVAQHQRILAASVGSAEPVAMKTHGAWDGLDDLANLPDGTKLYTHPADQVAEPDAELVELLKGLVEIAGRKKRGRPGSPNHSHSIPGIWDSDNGDLAGKPCAECALYDMAVARIAALQH